MRVELVPVIDSVSPDLLKCFYVTTAMCSSISDRANNCSPYFPRGSSQVIGNVV